MKVSPAAQSLEQDKPAQSFELEGGQETSKVSPEKNGDYQTPQTKKEIDVEDSPQKHAENGNSDKSDFLAYMGAIGAAIFLGLADYLASLLAKLGLSGIFAEWFGCLMAWLCYHGYCLTAWYFWGEPEDTHYFTKETSMYYEVDTDEQSEPATAVKTAERDLEIAVNGDTTKNNEVTKKFRFSWTKFNGMVSRAFFQLAIQLALLQTFYYGSKSGVNNGIISVIFSCGVIFTAIIFYFVYGQELTAFDLTGGLFIIVAVALISIGGTGGGHGGSDMTYGLTEKEKSTNLVLAVIMAIVTGLVFSLNSLSIQFCTSKGCGVAQANMDGMLIMFAIMLPGFLVIASGEDNPYGWYEINLATAILVAQVVGIISLSVGLANGSGGPVQAIENQKTTVQTVLEAAVQAHLPTAIQFGGLAAGILGVTVIVCQKSKENKEDTADK